MTHENISELFQGKETEHNWQERDNFIQQIPSDEILEAHDFLMIVDACLHSLRTQVALNTLNLIAQQTKHVQSHDTMSHIFAQLIKLASTTKKIVVNATVETTIAVIQQSDIGMEHVHLFTSKLSDKNGAFRSQITLFLYNIFKKHHDTPRYAQEIEGVLQKTLSDANPQVREHAKTILQFYKQHYAENYGKWVDECDLDVKKALEKLDKPMEKTRPSLRDMIKSKKESKTDVEQLSSSLESDLIIETPVKSGIRKSMSSPPKQSPVKSTNNSRVSSPKTPRKSLVPSRQSSPYRKTSKPASPKQPSPKQSPPKQSPSKHETTSPDSAETLQDSGENVQQELENFSKLDKDTQLAMLNKETFLGTAIILYASTLSKPFLRLKAQPLLSQLNQQHLLTLLAQVQGSTLARLLEHLEPNSEIVHQVTRHLFDETTQVRRQAVMFIAKLIRMEGEEIWKEMDEKTLTKRGLIEQFV